MNNKANKRSIVSNFFSGQCKCQWHRCFLVLTFIGSLPKLHFQQHNLHCHQTIWYFNWERSLFMTNCFYCPRFRGWKHFLIHCKVHLFNRYFTYLNLKTQFHNFSLLVVNTWSLLFSLYVESHIYLKHILEIRWWDTIGVKFEKLDTWT